MSTSELHTELAALVAANAQAEALLADAIENADSAAAALAGLRNEATRAEVRSRFAAGVPKVRLAREFGVGLSTIHRWLKAGKTN